MSSSPEAANATITEESTTDKKQEVEQLSENVADLYLEAFSFTTTAAIIGYVDRKICATLTDGRQLFGVLRSFDQYGSIVLQDTVERLYLPNNRFAENFLGVLLIRGENILLLGDIDIDKEDEPISKLQQIPYNEAKFEDKHEKELLNKEHKLKSKKLHNLGLVPEFFA